MNNEDLIFHEVSQLILFLSRTANVMDWTYNEKEILNEALNEALDEAIGQFSNEAKQFICNIHEILGNPTPIKLENTFDIFNEIYSVMYCALDEYPNVCHKVSEFFSPELLSEINIAEYKDIIKIISFFDSPKDKKEIMRFVYDNFITDKIDEHFRIWESSNSKMFDDAHL